MFKEAVFTVQMKRVAEDAGRARSFISVENVWAAESVLEAEAANRVWCTGNKHAGRSLVLQVSKAFWFKSDAGEQQNKSFCPDVLSPGSGLTVSQHLK